MTFSRYNSKQKFKNNNDEYKEHFQKRDVNFVVQYVTPKFDHIDANSLSELQVYTHIWKTGDRLYKLAYEHYDDATLWWIIAWYNKKPTEAHYEVGNTVYIPKPLNKILEIMGD
jgi:hypothetical protein